MNISTTDDITAHYLTRGVMFRRVLALLMDMILIGLTMWLLFWGLAFFGLITFGLGLGALSIMPFVPFLYHFLSLLGGSAATPGQMLLGLTVRRTDDLLPPLPLQALIYVVLFYLTIAATGLLFLVALFTRQHRTLHDLFSGLVVVRTDALQSLTARPVI